MVDNKQARLSLWAMGTSPGETVSSIGRLVLGQRISWSKGKGGTCGWLGTASCGCPRGPRSTCKAPRHPLVRTADKAIGHSSAPLLINTHCCVITCCPCTMPTCSGPSAWYTRSPMLPGLQIRGFGQQQGMAPMTGMSSSKRSPTSGVMEGSARVQPLWMVSITLALIAIPLPIFLAVYTGPQGHRCKLKN